MDARANRPREVQIRGGISPEITLLFKASLGTQGIRIAGGGEGGEAEIRHLVVEGVGAFPAVAAEHDDIVWASPGMFLLETIKKA